MSIQLPSMWWRCQRHLDLTNQLSVKPGMYIYVYIYLYIYIYIYIFIWRCIYIYIYIYIHIYMWHVLFAKDPSVLRWYLNELRQGPTCPAPLLKQSVMWQHSIRVPFCWWKAIAKKSELHGSANNQIFDTSVRSLLQLIMHSCNSFTNVFFSSSLHCLDKHHLCFSITQWFIRNSSHYSNHGVKQHHHHCSRICFFKSDRTPLSDTDV